MLSPPPESSLRPGTDAEEKSRRGGECLDTLPRQLPKIPRKFSKISPVQRTLAHLDSCGYELVQVVERWNAHARVRQDLFGIFDVLAIRTIPSDRNSSSCITETVGIQVTTGANVAARIKKIADHVSTPILRRAGWTMLVHGWRKSAAGRWMLREVDVS